MQMARALRLQVIAEGVGDRGAAATSCAQAGCDEFQGFLFAPALDALSFEQRLRQQAADGRHLRVVSR